MKVFRLDKNPVKLALPVLNIVEHNGEPTLSIKLAGTKFETGVTISDIVNSVIEAGYSINVQSNVQEDESIEDEPEPDTTYFAIFDKEEEDFE